MTVGQRRDRYDKGMAGGTDETSFGSVTNAGQARQRQKRCDRGVTKARQRCKKMSKVVKGRAVRSILDSY